MKSDRDITIQRANCYFIKGESRGFLLFIILVHPIMGQKTKRDNQKTKRDNRNPHSHLKRLLGHVKIKDKYNIRCICNIDADYEKSKGLFECLKTFAMSI